MKIIANLEYIKTIIHTVPSLLKVCFSRRFTDPITSIQVMSRSFDDKQYKIMDVNEGGRGKSMQKILFEHKML